MSLIAKDTCFKCRPALDRVLEENKRLVVVFNHSSPMSWIPAPCLLTAHAFARGGGRRRFVAVMDRFFYSLPLLRELAHYLSQSDRPLSFQELVDHFETLENADLVVFPEGSNSFFGSSYEMQPFRSSRFVEIAIRTKTPLLLCVHRGSEEWGRSFRVNSRWIDRAPLPAIAAKFLKHRLKATGVLTIPWLPRPMAKFSMNCELFEPNLQELPEDRDLCRTLIKAEAERVHARMRAMLTELDSGAPSTP